MLWYFLISNKYFCLQNVDRGTFIIYLFIYYFYPNRYLPQRFVNPGMAVIEIDLPSGFSADLESPDTHLDLVRKSEIRDEKTIVLYYDQVYFILRYVLRCKKCKIYKVVIQ